MHKHQLNGTRQGACLRRPLMSNARPQQGMPLAHMITRLDADEAMFRYLRMLEREMDLFGSSLPKNRNRPPHILTVMDVQEHDFGWVYLYNSKEYVESGDFNVSLVGNAPVIVDRVDGRLYGTGTSKPTEHYLNDFRRGIRHVL